MIREVEPQILYSEIFNETTFKITYVESTLNLTAGQLEAVKLNWKSYLEEAVRRGNTPWDGTYYRLENILKLQNGSKELFLSTIKYSQIRGLTYNVEASELSKESKPNHISTGSLIQTSDGYFIFGERNKNSMSTSTIDFIGGGLQPDELKVNSCADIFANQIKEMAEEIGIQRSTITKMAGIGIILSSKYTVLFIFLTRLNLTRDKALKIFRSHNDNEMNNLIFVEEARLGEFLKDKESYRPLVTELYLKNRASL